MSIDTKMNLKRLSSVDQKHLKYLEKETHIKRNITLYRLENFGRISQKRIHPIYILI